MTDEYKKTSDDEYQFPDDEYVAVAEKSPSVSHEHDDVEEDFASVDTESVQQEDSTPFDKLKALAERFPALQNKRVWLVVGIVLFAIIGFKIMGPSDNHMQPIKKQAAPVVTPQRNEQNAMLNKIDNLSRDVANRQGTVNALQSQLSDLKSSLNTANSNGIEMKNAVVALAQQVQNLSKQLKEKNIQAKPQKNASPALVYHLVAMVSGRAWVVGSNGESDSVAVGNKLKNYGTVKAIDVYTGKVITSSGKTITYNAVGN